MRIGRLGALDDMQHILAACDSLGPFASGALRGLSKNSEFLLNRSGHVQACSEVTHISIAKCFRFEQ